MIFWSPSRAAFFDARLKSRYQAADAWPADTVPITEADYADLQAQKSAGKVIVAENGQPVARDPAPPSTEERRAGLTCSRAQGIAVLGEANWAVIEAHGADPQTPWVTRAFINHAETWHRTSPALNELAPVLDLSPEEVDDLFVAAAATQI